MIEGQQWKNYFLKTNHKTGWKEIKMIFFIALQLNYSLS